VEASLGTDEGLIERATSGDAEAFAQLVAPHLTLARRIAASAGQTSDAEDAVQNALMKAHRSLASLDAGRDFAPWFLTIVRNEALNQGRTARRHEAAVGRFGDQPQQFASAPAEDIAIADAHRADIRAAVDRLNARDRAVIETRFLDEHTEAETAAELGLPIGTVKSRTSRALRRLRVVMVAVTLILAALAIAPVRRAVAGWLGLRGVRIEQPIAPPSGSSSTAVSTGALSSGPAPTVVSSPASSDEATTTVSPTAGFGETTTLDATRKAVTFTVRIPNDARVGDPDLVTLERDVAKGLVTLWWKPNDRLPLPASPNNRTWGMSFSAFRGSVEDWSFTKMLGPESRVEFVTVQGASGRWIKGAPHQLAIATDGENSTVTNRLATNTLLWERDGITYRLEANISRDLALSIADTVK
jgi:RNA polymerase sigma factor (sigma-70 family)